MLKSNNKEEEMESALRWPSADEDEQNEARSFDSLIQNKDEQGNASGGKRQCQCLKTN